ncbi:hypothetical protein DB30_03513 [Enhygromyxa salina]|uniref:Uncharacterized protein n=1 Tax=Enhygromyxa salina TaxID=215803 RepID=A0A0C2D6E8_9BACT|nr:hypothetical protein [Enhygromyxa salina]KIG17200.1 hypothetical protein DB30_03513 [Enhygromyxa salina]
MRLRSLLLVPLLPLACSTAPATCPDPISADLGPAEPTPAKASPAPTRAPEDQPNAIDWRELWVVLMSSTVEDRSKWPSSAQAALEELCIAGCEGAGPKLILHHEIDDDGVWGSFVRVAVEFGDAVAAGDVIATWGSQSFAPRCGAHYVEVEQASVTGHGDAIWFELELLVPEMIDTCEEEERDQELSWVEDDCESCQHVPRTLRGLYTLDGLVHVEGDSFDL